MNDVELWRFFPRGYALTVAIELPVLMLGLASRHSWRQRLAAAFWLTACTYPIVVLVLPSIVLPIAPRGVYLLIAETFAPCAECALFRVAFGAQRRDYGAILAANLLSFVVGEWLHALRAP